MGGVPEQEAADQPRPAPVALPPPFAHALALLLASQHSDPTLSLYPQGCSFPQTFSQGFQHSHPDSAQSSWCKTDARQGEGVLSDLVTHTCQALSLCPLTQARHQYPLLTPSTARHGGGTPQGVPTVFPAKSNLSPPSTPAGDFSSDRQCPSPDSAMAVGQLRVLLRLTRSMR